MKENERPEYPAELKALADNLGDALKAHGGDFLIHSVMHFPGGVSAGQSYASVANCPEFCISLTVNFPFIRILLQSARQSPYFRAVFLSQLRAEGYTLTGPGIGDDEDPNCNENDDGDEREE